MIQSADIRGEYRYRLSVDGVSVTGVGGVLWIMLNPSTADGVQLDPTMRRVIDFTARWGRARCTVMNLFALRATDPDQLLSHPSPVGECVDEAIRSAAREHHEVVFAWGAHPAALKRQAEVIHAVLAVGAAPLCLGRTRSGFPRHPLYVPASTKPEPFALEVSRG